MSNYTLLDNVTHKDIKIITDFSEAYGNNVGSVLTFPTEFSNIQKEYPILFQKDPETKKFRCIVLLGFKNNENLFLNEGKWNAQYIPAMILREPFLIGFQNQSKIQDQENGAVIHIDLDSPRVNKTEGQPLFLDLGGNSPYLNRVAKSLEIIHQGLFSNDEMFEALAHFDLLEPVKLDFTLNNGQEHTITGNYTINKQKLNDLSGEDLQRLNQAGILQNIFLAISSMDNVYKLINMKNSEI